MVRLPHDARVNPMSQTDANRMGRITAMIEILSLKVLSSKPLRASSRLYVT
jgi:hypothetical protein